MKKIINCIGLCFFGALSTFSQQDQHFSMFNESTVLINPATAGFSEGDLQLFTNFRQQWGLVSDQPYRTISASADWSMLDNGGSFMGAGVNFINDVAGVSKYQTNVISIPVNYAIQIDQKNFFSIGLQPGFYQRVLKNEDISWDSQWNGTYYDKSLNNNESLLTQNFNTSRFDIGAGIYWEGYFSKTAKLSLGLSGQHLTKQRINFTGDETRLYRKLTFHGQGEFKRENSGVTIMPGFVAFLQGPNKEITVGSSYRFILKSASRTTSYFDEVTFTLGTYFRVGDAILVNGVLDMAGFSIGAGYDINISKLSLASKGVGGMEFFLRYRIQFGTGDLGNIRVK